jgi:signal transduction histidine kinase/CheY-like chemotaxis protein
MVEAASEEARLQVEKETEIARLKVIKMSSKLQPDDEAIGAVLLKIKEAVEIAQLKVERAAEVARRVLSVEMANHELQQAKELAEANTRGKSQFLANMSHELRTPMTGVLGMLDLVLLGNLEAEQREFINAAHTSARSLVLILNDILDMTKIEMGKFSIASKPFSLRKCVESTFSILFPAAKSKGLDLNLTVAADVPDTLVGDQIRLSQVLTNLAGNAVKFTAQGKVEICVAAGDSAPDGKREVTFSVTDTGIGIPDNKKDLLFRVFSQVDDSHSRSYGGTGLGLAISKQIVESMGGTINFTSEEGKGSVFFCTIPFAEGEAAHSAGFAPGITATADDVPRAEKTNKARLLIAEDDDTIRQVLGEMLRMSKYETDFAENGQLVVKMWENGKYDLILMDVQMPLMNGFEATAAIREKERTLGGHIPIIAMTAHALKEDEDRCLDAGMDAYISKPIDFMTCLQLIGETLKNSAGGKNLPPLGLVPRNIKI